MSIKKYEELHPQQQVLPNDVIEKAVLLQRIFKDQFKQILRIDLSDVAQATGMIFFYKFYEKRQNISPKDYALYAISCLHLATKVCESPIPITKFTNCIIQASGDWRSGFQDIFDTLDGIKIPSPKNTTEIVELNEKLLKSEMRAIVALDFNFDVVKPHDLLENYIEKILKWHLKPDSEFYQPLKAELIGYCKCFLNDLQITPIFYLYKPELLAISIISMAFKIIKLPLVSPVKNPWYFYLAPNLIDSEVLGVINEVDNFFTDLFVKQRKQVFFERKTNIPDIIMEKTWIKYPYFPFKNIPLCPPPPLSKIDKLVKGSESFTDSELDHIPKFPPPDKKLQNPNLIQFNTEFPVMKAKKKRDEDKKRKNKNNSPNQGSSLRHSKHSNNGHMRPNHNDIFPLSPQHHNFRGHDADIGHHHRHGYPNYNPRFDMEYEYDVEYRYQHFNPPSCIPSAQSDRREPRRKPRESERAGNGVGSQPRGRERYRDDPNSGYYPYEFKRLSPLPPQKRRDRIQDPHQYPSPPPRDRERDRLNDGEKRRDRDRDLPQKNRDKEYNDSPRIFKGPPPGHFRPSDRDRERDIPRDEDERDRERERDRNRDRDRDRNRNNEKGRNRDKAKAKDSDKNRDNQDSKNRFNGKNKGNNMTNNKKSPQEYKADSKEIEQAKNVKKSQP